jgi:hypothetical protein
MCSELLRLGRMRQKTTWFSKDMSKGRNWVSMFESDRWQVGSCLAQCEVWVVQQNQINVQVYRAFIRARNEAQEDNLTFAPTGARLQKTLGDSQITVK